MGFQITGVPEADAVLDEYPLAIVIGMQLDQQYGIEHAFRGGYKILTRFGSLDTAVIAAADPEVFTAACRTPPAIHRFPGAKAKQVQELARLVEAKYDGDVARLWTEARTGADLLARIKELPGYGDQTAKILVALLGKQVGVQPTGWKAAAGDYALKGYRSVADVTGPESLARVREFKQAAKAAKKAAAAGVDGSPAWTAPTPPEADGPTTGPERPMLDAYLGFQRRTLLNICAGLDAEQLARRALPPSRLSLLGIVRHLGKVERIWFRIRAAGEDVPPMFDPGLGVDPEFELIDASAAAEEIEKLQEEWRRCDAALADLPLEATLLDRDGREMSLRMTYLHVLNEYARHNGHADLLREQIDGVTGR